MPAGVVMGAMPEMQSGDAGFFIEYRFVKPIKYSGHRMVTSHSSAECDPRDWRVIVDCVNQENGDREEQNLTI